MESCSRERRSFTTSDGTDLSLLVVAPNAPQAVVVYVHGTQSHTGWLFETGDELARRGVAVYAADRRGSGLSDGTRGDVNKASTWINDYLEVLSHARAQQPKAPITLLGQSAGGAIAVGMALRSQSAADNLLLVAPALGLLHARLPNDELERIRSDLRPAPPERVTLRNEQYTTNSHYLDFMANDRLMLRALTPRFRAAMLELEETHLRPDVAIDGLPMGMALPEQDSVIDRNACIGHFKRLSKGRGVHLTLPSSDHYLDFSEQRFELWNFIVAFACTNGLTLGR